jgi:hypothetical protein
MALEFALRPRFDVKRPARRRRPSWLRLHPLVVPIGTYWLVASGLTYAFIHSASVEVAGAAEPESGSSDWSNTDAPPSEPPMQSPIVAAAPPPEIAQQPSFSPPEPEPLIEPLPVESPPERPRDAAPRFIAAAEPPPGRPPPRALPDDLSALTQSFDASAAVATTARREREDALAREELERAVEPAPSPREEPRAGSLPSCESAAATANQIIEVGSARGAPDLTRDAFAGVLEHGAYLIPCAIPPRSSVEICAAVQNGKVVGVTVTTEPRDARINACVRHAVTALRFPRSPGLDVTRTRFDRER